MSEESLCFLSATELSSLIKSREVSPVEVTRAHLSRIDRLNEELRAFLHIDYEGALAAARVAEQEVSRGQYRGPLHGITVGYKDIFHVSGLPTTAHSRVLANYVADKDATMVARLRRAGTITLGKLNTWEFASGGMDVWGKAVNPWDTLRTPGGSSAGSGTALAAHMVTLAAGTDTGGSIRLPAAFCGVVGLRPTYGRISKAGVIPLSWSLDTAGPMARTVSDVALMLSVVAGWDQKDPASKNVPVGNYLIDIHREIKGIRIGVPNSFFFTDLDPHVDSAVRLALKTLESLGAKLEEVTIPHLDLGTAASWTISYSEAFSFHRAGFFTQRHNYGDAFVRKITSAGLLSSIDFVTALRVQKLITTAFLNALSTVDLIVTPTTPVVAYHPNDNLIRSDHSRFTRPVSLTGLPALAIPCGFSPEGLPISLQIVGRHWEESLLLRVGHQYQCLTGWHNRKAPLKPGTVTKSESLMRAPASPGVDVGWVEQRVRSEALTYVEPRDYEPLAITVMPIRNGLARARELLPLELELVI